MTKTRRSMLDRPGRWTIKPRSCKLGLMHAPDPFPPADPFGEALHFLRMTGAYYCRSELTAPWGLTLPPMPGYMWFHVVTAGRMWLETGEEVYVIGSSSGTSRSCRTGKVTPFAASQARLRRGSSTSTASWSAIATRSFATARAAHPPA